MEDDGVRTFALRDGEEVAPGIGRIAAGRALCALEGLEAARDRSAELSRAVHEARKDLKKVRAVIRLVRDDLGDEIYRRENARFGEAGRRLSAARDAEVKLQTLVKLRERSEDFPSGGVAVFEVALGEERDTASETGAGTAAEALSASAAQIAEGLKEIEHWPLHREGFALVSPGLLRSYGRGRRRFADARRSPDEESIHEWRKRAKDLWYQLRICEGAWPEVIGATADQAHELGDLLGDHHDLAVLGSDAETRPHLFESPGDLEALRTLIGQAQSELMLEAFSLGDRLYAEKPEAFRRRMSALWGAWRN